MNIYVYSMIVGAVLFFTPLASKAGPILSLSSVPKNFSDLTIGDPVRFDVILSGLNPGDEIEFLAATVQYPSHLFSLPTISSGPIIPDATGFLESSLPGLADANYDSLFSISGATITDNGVFFSFETTLIGSGSGTVRFDFVDSFGTDSFGNQLPVTTGSGPIQVSTAVPEPSSLLLLSLSGLGVGTSVLTRRLLRKSCL